MLMALDEALRLANRREDLAHRQHERPACPDCGEVAQIQLIDHFVTPAVWRCRTCRREYTWEPLPKTGE